MKTVAAIVGIWLASILVLVAGEYHTKHKNDPKISYVPYQQTTMFGQPAWILDCGSVHIAVYEEPTQSAAIHDCGVMIKAVQEMKLPACPKGGCK